MNKILLKLLFTVLAVLLAAEVMAQVPQGFNFQAVARDANGDLIIEQTLGVQITILSGSETGTAVYTETHTPATNASGSFQIVIGEGTSENDFSAIDWSSNNYYVKLEIDPAGGTTYEELGTTRLLSVPYALLAQNVVNGTSGELGNEFTLNSSVGDTSFIVNAIGTTGLSAIIGNASTDAANKGVFGTATSTSTNAANQYGVQGIASGEGSGAHTGTHGYAKAGEGGHSKGAYGGVDVSGNSSSYFDIGVSGQAFGNLTNSTTFSVGTYGQNTVTGGSEAWGTGGYAGGDGINRAFRGRANSLNGNESEQFGAWVQANGEGSGNHYGVWARGAGLGINYGIYATADGGTENYAGYFDGPTVVNGDLTVNGSINGSSSTEHVLVQNQSGVGVVSINSHGVDTAQGLIHLYGKTPEGSNNLRAELQVDNNDVGDTWGKLALKGPVFDNGNPRSFVNAYVTNDPGGNDPTGWFGQLDLQGNSSPNIIMGGNGWEGSDLPMIQLFGNKPTNDGWFYNHANLSVNRDGDQEWGALSLSANNGVANVEIGAKSWEDPIEGAGRPYMSFKGNNTTDDLIYMEVSHDGTNEFGNLNFNSTDGSSLSINANGLNGNVNIDGGNLHVSGDITAGGTITETSDRNLKENIQPLQNGISTIMRLNPSTYNFRGNGEYNGLMLSTGLRYGLIAQEVEEVLPSLVKDNIHTYSESVNTGSGPDMTSENEITKTMEYKSMNYTELVPILIKAVQEQQEVIEQLQKEVEKLKKD